jgi:hypothetical protein
MFTGILGNMAQEILEGTWEEVSQHAREFAGKRVRLTVLEEAEPAHPNEAMLSALRKVRERTREMPYSGSTEESVRMLREGRAGKMFGYDPTE